MISLSIIIPVYNVEQYVQRCLESVVTQDILAVNIECIIINDSSQDNSMIIVRQFVSAYNGPILFKIVEHERNRGLSAARNIGLKQASGDYVLFIDSDDYLMPNSLVSFFTNLRNHPNVDMIVGNVRNCKANNLLIHNIQEPCLIDDHNVFVPMMLRHQIYLYAWNKCIRRELLIKNHIFFEEGILFEDQCWSYELFSYLSSLLLLPQVTYVYENNSTSIVNTAFSQERADLVLGSYTVSINKILNNPPNPYRYHQNLIVDYYLYMMTFLMNGVDLLSRYSVCETTANDFRELRVKLISHSFKHGRLLLSFFFLLLFPPFCYFQRTRIFRKNIYYIEAIVNRICHVTDFLHNKNRL